MRKLRWIAPVLQVILLYGIAGIQLYGLMNHFSLPVWVASLPVSPETVFLLVVGGLLVLNAILVPLFARRARAGWDPFFHRAALIIKVALIPFFIINFLYLALPLVLMAAFSGGLALLFGPVYGAATYLALLPGSFYGLAAILSARRNQMLSKGASVALGICLFIFGVDVIAAIVLAAMLRKHRGAQAQ